MKTKKGNSVLAGSLNFNVELLLYLLHEWVYRLSCLQKQACCMRILERSFAAALFRN